MHECVLPGYLTFGVRTHLDDQPWKRTHVGPGLKLTIEGLFCFAVVYWSKFDQIWSKQEGRAVEADAVSAKVEPLLYRKRVSIWNFLAMQFTTQHDLYK